MVEKEAVVAPEQPVEQGAHLAVEGGVQRPRSLDQLAG